MSRLVDTAVYGSAQMLNKGAVDSSVDLAYGKQFVCGQFCFHKYVPPQIVFGTNMGSRFLLLEYHIPPSTCNTDWQKSGMTFVIPLLAY